MSAFICGNYHISALAVYATRKHNSYIYHNDTLVSLTDAEEVARILFNENVRSVNYRYQDNEQYQADEPAIFTFCRDAIRYSTTHSVVDIIKAANCYEYQACETPDYTDSLAHEVIEFIITKAIHSLPGYEAADWGLDNPGPRLEARRIEISASRHSRLEQK